MSNFLIGVLVGGFIGIIAGILTACLVMLFAQSAAVDSVEEPTA